MHHSRGRGTTRGTELVELADGEEFELEIMPVKKRIGDATVRMLACNGSPGPTLNVRRGAITVHVANDGDLYATSRPDVEPGRRLLFRASPPRDENNRSQSAPFAR